MIWQFDTVAVAPVESLTLAENVAVPCVVAVPDTTPVLVFSVKPAGSAPPVMVYDENGADPPCTVNADEYTLFTFTLCAAGHCS